MKKINYILQAAVVIGIALVLVMPGAAAFANTKTLSIAKSDSPTNNPLGRDEGWIEQNSCFWDPSRGIRYLHATDENIAWAVGYDGSGGGEYKTWFTKTTNGGDLWEAELVIGDDTYGLGNICGINGITAWAAVFYAGAQDDTCGIYKTTDGGDHWVQQPPALQGAESFANNVYFWDENEGMCQGDLRDGYFEVYTSNDGGETWTRVPEINFSGDPPVTGEAGWTGCIDVIGDTVLFGTHNGYVWKSDDRGHTWTGSYTGMGPGGLNPGVNEIAFKDSNHGLAAHDEGAYFSLYETLDGGANWAQITPTGTVYSSGLSYVPGTENMYVTTGADYTTPAMGASYSYDGGHTWITWNEMLEEQMLACDFVEGGIGWAGAFNTDEFTGGMWKYIPGTEEPVLVIESITGGKGITVVIKNIGNADATGVEYDITIEGGLIIIPRADSGDLGTIAPGDSETVTFGPMGIGLGIITPMPKITVAAECTEGSSDETIRNGRIILFRVLI